MDFIKTFSHRSGRYGGVGSLIISNKILRITINKHNSRLKEIGLVKGGIGVVIEDATERKTKYVKNNIPFDSKDIPIELQGEKYRFRIPCEQLSDTEYVFMFDKARMLNKK